MLPGLALRHHYALKHTPNNVTTIPASGISHITSASLQRHMKAEKLSLSAE
jgi:hypothetical protein